MRGFFVDVAGQDFFGINDFVGMYQVNFQAKTLQFLDKHVEAFWNLRTDDLRLLDDRLVSLGAAVDVVRLNGQHFLQGVGGAVSFECPDLHFAKALTTVLGLTTERLLGDHGVWTG